MRLAECHVKLDSKHDAASTYVDAANSYKKTNLAKSVQCLEMAIEAFTELGRLSLVAKHHKDIGEILEGENNIEKAMFHYEQVGAEYARRIDHTSRFGRLLFCFCWLGSFLCIPQLVKLVPPNNNNFIIERSRFL
jgi:alpha-soluble NSF attachment protein